MQLALRGERGGRPRPRPAPRAGAPPARRAGAAHGLERPRAHPRRRALLEGLDGADVYFAHSFAAEPAEPERRRRDGGARRPDRRRRRARRRSPASSSTPSGAAAAGARVLENVLAMVKKRVIPCLDVAGGRVVKGVRFESLRDVGDPVELALALLGARRGRARLPRHHGDARGTRADRSTSSSAPPSELTIPFTVGGGVTGARRRARAAARRGRQGGRQPRRRSTTPGSSPRSPTSSARRRSSARSTPRAGEVVTHAGPRLHAAGTPSTGRGRPSSAGAGEILLTSIDADGTRAGYDLELTRGGRRGRSRCR